MDVSVLVPAPAPSREFGSVERDTDKVMPRCDKVADIQKDIDEGEPMSEAARAAWSWLAEFLYS